MLNPNAHQGIILVPLKGFREDRDTKDSEKDRGVGLCYIFMSPEFNPLVDGKPATDKQIRKLKLNRRRRTRHHLPGLQRQARRGRRLAAARSLRG